jgi:hypothetical protein
MFILLIDVDDDTRSVVFNDLSLHDRVDCITTRDADGWCSKRQCDQSFRGGLFLFLMDEKHDCRGGHTRLRMLVSKQSLVSQAKKKLP